MIYRIAADAVLVTHLAFIVFVVLGGLLSLHSPRWLFVHLPAAAWGAFVELSGRICPLTIWENDLRRLAGQDGYPESFIDHYLLPVIYPAGLTQDTQLLLGAGVIVTNLLIYGAVLWRRQT